VHGSCRKCERRLNGAYFLHAQGPLLDADCTGNLGDQAANFTIRPANRPPVVIKALVYQTFAADVDGLTVVGSLVRHAVSLLVTLRYGMRPNNNLIPFAAMVVLTCCR